MSENIEKDLDRLKTPEELKQPAEVGEVYQISDDIKLSFRDVEYFLSRVTPEQMAAISSNIRGNTENAEYFKIDPAKLKIREGKHHEGIRMLKDIYKETKSELKVWQNFMNVIQGLAGSNRLLGPDCSMPRILCLNPDRAKFFFRRNKEFLGQSKNESPLKAENNGIEFIFVLDPSDSSELIQRMSGYGIVPEKSEGKDSFSLKIGDHRFLFLEADMSKLVVVKRDGRNQEEGGELKDKQPELVKQGTERKERLAQKNADENKSGGDKKGATEAGHVDIAA